MNAGALIAGILLSLYEPIRALVDDKADADVVSNALHLTLEAASLTAQARIAARAGRPVDASKVLAHRSDDLARAFDAAGFAADASIIRQLAARHRRDARSEDDTREIPTPGSAR